LAYGDILAWVTNVLTDPDGSIDQHVLAIGGNGDFFDLADAVRAVGKRRTSHDAHGISSFDA
jgi:hypothetical protein